MCNVSSLHTGRYEDQEDPFQNHKQTAVWILKNKTKSKLISGLKKHI